MLGWGISRHPPQRFCTLAQILKPRGSSVVTDIVRDLQDPQTFCLRWRVSGDAGDPKGFSEICNDSLPRRSEIPREVKEFPGS